MKKAWIAAALAALVCLAAACSGSGQEGVNPASPSLAAAAPAANGTVVPAANQGKVEREIAGTLAGRFDFTNTWGDEWYEFYSDCLSTGTVTHFGLSELRTRHIPTLEMALTDGTFTLVAANGDEISGTYEGTAWYDAESADLAHGEATFVVKGGTGRFEHATGRITATFLEVFDDPTWASAGATWTLSGTVRY